MKRVGFIGLGLMGGPMARNVLKQEFPLTVYDVVRERVDVLVAVGAKAAASPGEVAQASDVVFTVASALGGEVSENGRLRQGLAATRAFSGSCGLLLVVETADS